MVEIVLIRHGETEWNIKKMFRGRKDVGLSETGVKQVKLLGKFLSNYELDAIYSSPLKRSWETAVAISEKQSKNMEVTESSELIDMNFESGKESPSKRWRRNTASFTKNGWRLHINWKFPKERV